MSVPGIVQSTLDGEDVAARVSLGGEDELFVTPSSTLIYRAEGLLSDESVDEYPHDADRLTLSEGRRKTRFTLEYAIGGEKEFTVPASKTEAVLHPVLAGVLNGNGITDSGETVEKTYRFSELTLIVTSNRLVKHIGEAVWDGDFEQYHFEDVTNLSFEDGSVATQIVIEVDGRPQRIKAPNEQADDVCERLKRALFSYHGVDSLEALNEAVGEDEEERPAADPAVDFGEGVAPLNTDSSESADESDDDATADSGRERPAASAAVAEAGAGTANETATTDESAADAGGFDGSGFQPATAGADEDLLERLDRLEAAVEEQTDLLKRQQETIEQLITELRAGR